MCTYPFFLPPVDFLIVVENLHDNVCSNNSSYSMMLYLHYPKVGDYILDLHDNGHHLCTSCG